MDVTFTTAPLAATSSSISPRASMTGAKKLIWKTVFQSSSLVSSVLRRPPPGFLGLMAALLTSACSFEPWAFNFSRITAMAAWVSAEEARSTVM